MAIMGKESPVFKNNAFTISNGKIAPTNGDANGNKLGDYYPDKKGKLRKAKGLHWVLAALFVVADMAGGGIVALPTAVVRCQFYPGLVILGTMAVMATSSAIMLGKSWVILLRRFPVYRTHCRKPYAEMGYRAMGATMQTIVSICVNFTQFGASTVFLLLSSKNIQDFIHAFFSLDLSFCIVILIVAVMLLPITLLKSPQDFWPVIVLGMLSTGVAVVLICIGAGLDFAKCAPAMRLPPFSVANYLVALGTILFTYGGHSAFPTIQHDMRRPSEFGKAAVLAFTIITIFNVTAVALGGLTYGNSLRDSVINSIQSIWIQQAVNLMITAHCLLTVTLIINPLNQEVEEAFNIPHEFGIKRIAIRTAMLLMVVFVAESVPNFGSVLELIGGSTVTLTSVVFPCLFYLYLSAGEKKQREQQLERSSKDEDHLPSFREMVERTDFKTLTWCGFIIIMSCAAGLVATGSALKSLTTSHFIMPCYLQPFFPGEPAGNFTATSTNCCGPFQNISRYSETSSKHCNKPDLNFF